MECVKSEEQLWSEAIKLETEAQGVEIKKNAEKWMIGRSEKTYCLKTRKPALKASDFRDRLKSAPAAECFFSVVSNRAHCRDLV